MLCRACRASLSEDARFCPSCGEKAAAQAQPAAADPVRATLETALRHRYEIVRLLGRGGMGRVYLARETALDRLVAIKVLPPRKAEGGELEARFRREARTAARLTHPGIVPLHSFGEADGTLYYVMGYVRGESLAARLRREGRPSFEDSRRILGDLADALDYAHRQGVVHRDIKPDNVMLDDGSGRPLLADFGVAKADDSSSTLTEVGAVVGTPRYMAPEQAAGKATDGRADLYSLGVLGYELLSGRLPFEGPTPRDVLLQHLSQEPPSLGRVAPGVPADLASAVMRCLEKQPDARWPDGRSLRDALQWTGAESELPSGLKELDGIAWRLALLALGTAYLLIFDLSWRGQMGPVGRELLRVAKLLVGLLWLAFGLVVPLGPLRKALQAGLGWAGALRLAIRQPTWWPSWTPRGLRRPGDVWARLPAVVRQARTALGLMLVTISLMFSLPIVRMSPEWDILHAGHPAIANALLDVLRMPAALAGTCLLVAALRLALWLRSRPLDSDVPARLWSEPTARPAFWRQPQIAALLLPLEGGGPGHTPSEPRAPRDLLRSLLQAGEDAAGPARQAATQAAGVARELVARLDALDDELRAARQEFDSGEVEKIDARLRMLGPAAPAESEERARMRTLLLQQREVAARWASRIEERAAHRARLLGLLDEIAAEVHAVAARGEPAPASPDRLLAVCARASSQAIAERGFEASQLGALESLSAAETRARGSDPCDASTVAAPPGRGEDA